ncbi:MAG: hypothetical protein P4N60_00420 [Verrucomicrobiae bacterium]|nr:hypothetical protein [Verrucomicrobiae bacterium]
MLPSARRPITGELARGHVRRPGDTAAKFLGPIMQRWVPLAGQVLFNQITHHRRLRASQRLCPLLQQRDVYLRPIFKVTVSMRSVYSGYGRTSISGDLFAVIIEENSGHTVKPAAERAAIDWFVKWLKP